MATCPSCENSIDSLDVWEEVRTELTVDASGQGDYGEPETVSSSYRCPECVTELFTDDGEACSFLKRQGSRETRSLK